MNIEEIKAKYGPLLAKANRAQLEELAMALLRAHLNDCEVNGVWDTKEYCDASRAAFALLDTIKATPQVPTIRVRAAVAADQYGAFKVAGWSNTSDTVMEMNVTENCVLRGFPVYFIEADIPIQQAKTIEARMVEGGGK